MGVIQPLICRYNSFIEKSAIKHNNFYDYSEVNYINNSTKVKIICPEHGEFEQRPSHHLKGNSCPKCAIKIKSNNMCKDTKYFIEQANKVHKDKYDYSLVNYTNSKEKVKIICPIHGIFEQRASLHLSGYKCSKCGNIEKSKSMIKGVDEFIKISNIKHKNKYKYRKNTYISMRVGIKIICPTHGEFEQLPHNHVNGAGCPKCSNSGISKLEQELFKFISKYIPSEQSNRIVLDGKELDIFIPSKNLGIEFNGLYWHSSKFKNKKDHLDKLNLANSKGIRLIQIFEDEWSNKQEIVKSRLLNILGLTPNKVYARKTEVREVSIKDTSNFLVTNHIQGKLGAKVRLGLYHNNELVSLMTFGSLRKNLGYSAKTDHYELLRFCNKLNTNVVGGASKLFKYFVENYSPKEIISYADRRWSEGNLYNQLGFEFERNTEPNYFYIIGNQRENRFKYRKSELVNQNFDPLKTESKIMEERGIYRIYDCGTKVYKNILI